MKRQLDLILNGKGGVGKSFFAVNFVTMTRMEEWLVEGLNRENLTVTAAARHQSFYLLDRQRLVSWQRKLYAEIESAAGLLLPGQSSAQPSNARTERQPV